MRKRRYFLYFFLVSCVTWSTFGCVSNMANDLCSNIYSKFYHFTIFGMLDQYVLLNAWFIYHQTMYVGGTHHTGCHTHPRHARISLCTSLLCMYLKRVTFEIYLYDLHTENILWRMKLNKSNSIFSSPKIPSYVIVSASILGSLKWGNTIILLSYLH